MGPKCDGVDKQSGDSRVKVQVQRQSAGRIPSCSGRVSLCSVNIFTWLGVLSPFSCVWLFWESMDGVAWQVLLSMGFSREEYWNGSPLPPPGNLPNSGIKPTYLTSPVLLGGFFITRPPGKISLCLLMSSTDSTHTYYGAQLLHGGARIWVQATWLDIQISEPPNWPPKLARIGTLICDGFRRLKNIL